MYPAASHDDGEGAQIPELADVDSPADASWKHVNIEMQSDWNAAAFAINGLCSAYETLTYAHPVATLRPPSGSLCRTMLRGPRSPSSSKYESGERNLDVVEFVSVCRVLGISPSSVLEQL